MAVENGHEGEKAYTCWKCGEIIYGTTYDAFHHLNYDCQGLSGEQDKLF